MNEWTVQHGTNTLENYKYGSTNSQIVYIIADSSIFNV